MPHDDHTNPPGRPMLSVIVPVFNEQGNIKPLGMVGSQKVKTFFINHKVPRSQRLLCPILVSGERIIWVGGYRIDDSAKITQRTKNVLKAELLPANMINRD